MIKINLLNEIEKEDINELILNSDIIYAHINDGNDSETLKEHSDLVLQYLYKLCDEKNIDQIITNITVNLEYSYNKMNKEISDFITCMFVNAVFLHDIGKINPAFQKNKMDNNYITVESIYDTHETNHSLLSAVIYTDIYLNKIEKKIKDRKIIRYLFNILYCFAYIISRHHTYLEDLSKVEFIEELEKKLYRLQEDDFEVRYYKYKDRLLSRNGFNKLKNREKRKYNPIKQYILCKLLFSAIVSCDFYATYTYDSGSVVNFNYIDDVEKVFDVYKNTKIFKGIQKYKNNKKYFGENSINALRSEMFLESEESLLRNINDSNIFYLEAPTGSGKTNISINLALNIIKNKSEFNKVFYIFPYNTLIEQTKQTFDKIFSLYKEFKIAVINSISPIITEQEQQENEDIKKIDYGKDLLNRQMLHYPVALITHINFFNYLFGSGREINLPLIHLCNSVVVIDEIQSYRNIIWPEIIEFLNTYSEMLNIKIIIMSATLPKLDKLLRNKDKAFINLIKNKDRYYKDDLFRNRVEINFGLLNYDTITEEKLIKAVDEVYKERKQARILIEFITKKTARKFYNIFKEKYKKKRKVVEVTGDDSSYIRRKLLEEINADDGHGNFKVRDILVVATQVIEAGVDIDMDIGFKDISMLDGEEQFLGRINRSCKRKRCCAYFFNYDNAAKIYKKDFRLEYNLMHKEYQKYLEDKNFNEFYKKCFIRLYEKKNECNENNIGTFFENEVMNLNFKQVGQNMKLIEEQNYQIFLSHKIKIDKDIILDGKLVWEEYKNLINDNKMNYAEKRIKLSMVLEKLSYFTYNYLDFGDKFDKKPKFFNEHIGNIFFIENGIEFITKDGKFNREKYNKKLGSSSGGLIL